MKLCAADLIVLKTRAVQKFAVYMQKYMQNQHKVAWYGKEHWIQLLINFRCGKYGFTSFFVMPQLLGVNDLGGVFNFFLFNTRFFTYPQ
jgi:hypothetical protein